MHGVCYSDGDEGLLSYCYTMIYFSILLLLTIILFSKFKIKFPPAMKEERMLIQIVAEQPESAQTPQQWYV